MTDTPIENKDDNLENLISQSLEQTNNEPDNASTNTKENILTPHLISESAQQLSKMLARKTGIASMELTKEDKEDLENALIPLEDKLDSLIAYLPYLPIMMFAVAYGLRVFGEYQHNKKEKLKEKKEKNKDKNKNDNEPIVIAQSSFQGTTPPIDVHVNGI
jgi:hypothetical protein